MYDATRYQKLCYMAFDSEKVQVPNLVWPSITQLTTDLESVKKKLIWNGLANIHVNSCHKVHYQSLHMWFFGGCPFHKWICIVPFRIFFFTSQEQFGIDHIVGSSQEQSGTKYSCEPHQIQDQLSAPQFLPSEKHFPNHRRS